MNEIEMLKLIRWTAHQVGQDVTLDEARSMLEQYLSEKKWPKIQIKRSLPLRDPYIEASAERADLERRRLQSK